MKKILFLIAFMVTGIIATQAKGYNVGDKVKDFHLKNVDGNYISMKDYPDAKGFIIIFTCNHCPYVKLYEDRIIKLNDEFVDKGYPVITISPMSPVEYPEDSFDNMVKLAEEKGYTFPYLYDDGQKVYPDFGATKTPEVYVVQKEGDDYILKYTGAIDDNVEHPEKVEVRYTANAVNALLNNQAFRPMETKAIGCTIK
ncbi:MAG: thioredoxin family protein [Hyphomicrobiales bacterium]